MNNKITVFLPTRKGSERVLKKNTRKFSSFEGGLLELKLNQLIKSSLIGEIVLSTNDEESILVGNEFAKRCEKVRVVIRPDSLALSTTSLTDLVDYVPSIASFNHILWTHVTSPFVTEVDYDKAITEYFNALTKEYDSLMSVKKFQNFLWSKEAKDIINRVSREKWPKTQDLMDLYEINSALFISTKTNYNLNNDRIGKNPYLFEQDNLKSFDIDWEDDFELAEFIYNQKNSK